MKRAALAAARIARTTAPPQDDDADESSVQRIVPATGAARPQTTAPNSVFDAGRQARVASEPARIDLATIVIRQGVPKPPPRRGVVGYLPVILHMQPGDSVELPLKQARGFYARAKQAGVAATPPQRFSFRRLSAQSGAIWRDE